MAVSAVAQFGSIVGATSGSVLSADCLILSWYATYTSANHERRVAEQLAVRDVEHFLPTYSSVRRWKDRRVTLDMPLLPGYLFVKMALQDRLRGQQVPGVARLGGFNGLPCPLPASEIGAMRTRLARTADLEPRPYWHVRRRV